MEVWKCNKHTDILKNFQNENCIYLVIEHLRLSPPVCQYFKVLHTQFILFFINYSMYISAYNKIIQQFNHVFFPHILSVKSSSICVQGIFQFLFWEFFPFQEP
uniref:Uncharacterized protein n=1 Tax=Micrurus carvalhoi TaxID=3147026 RepID=A0A2H6NC54_9SAUR